ncbi:MAG: fimbrillin family protein [Alistipes sp.]|nr:fimbrillin family protein [Alistipes sp.]
MKKFFVSMLAVAALASCAKEETLTFDKGEAIGFSSFVDNATRATDPSYGGATGQKPLTSFKVWGTANGVSIFNDTVVTGSVGGSWSYSTKQYWIEGVKYNFAALVNADNVTLGSDKLPAKIEFESNGSTDLLYVRTDEITGQATGYNSPVNLTFNHLLSKVHIGVKNNSSSAVGYSFLVKDIKINAPKNGTYYIQNIDEKTAGTWDVTNSDYSFANISVKDATAECNAEQLLIPGSATVSFNVDIIYTNDKNVESTIVTKNYSKNVTLVAGNAYNFNIITSVGDPIEFTVTQQPTWGDGDEGGNLN